MLPKCSASTALTGSKFERAAGELSSVCIDKFVMVAWEGFRLIEPWETASCDHPIVNETISALKEQCSNYITALDSSVKVIDAGHTICSEAEVLCNGFISQDYSDEELVEFVAGMKAMAEQACRDAESACEKFRGVRRGLIAIQHSMKVNLGEIVREREKSEGFLKKAMKRRKRAHKAVKMGRMIVLPAKLPIFDSLFERIEGSISRGARTEISKREQQQLTCDQGLETLAAAATYVEQLNQQISSIIAWWVKMTTTLSDVGRSIGVVRGIGTVRMRLVASKWKESKEDYLGAKIHLRRFQDYYPSRPNPSGLIKNAGYDLSLNSSWIDLINAIG